jgi:Ca2+-binding EF-hand superfamily protein
MVLALMKRSPEESREDGERLFEMFDEDGGGTVDLDE